MSAAGSFTGTNAGKLTGSGTKVNSYNKGKVRCLADQCYATGTLLGVGSIMAVGKLPKGAVVLYSTVMPIDSDDLTNVANGMTNAVTVSIGTAADPDLFGLSATLAVAAAQTLQPVPDGTIYTGLTPLAAEVNVIATTVAAQELVATEGIDVKIFYVVE